MSDLLGNHIVGFPMRRLKFRYTFYILDVHGETHGFSGFKKISFQTKSFNLNRDDI